MALATTTVTIQGTCESRLQRVHDAFAENVAQHGDRFRERSPCNAKLGQKGGPWRNSMAVVAMRRR